MDPASDPVKGAAILTLLSSKIHRPSFPFQGQITGHLGPLCYKHHHCSHPPSEDSAIPPIPLPLATSTALPSHTLYSACIPQEAPYHHGSLPLLAFLQMSPSQHSFDDPPLPSFISMVLNFHVLPIGTYKARTF